MKLMDVRQCSSSDGTACIDTTLQVSTLFLVQKSMGLTFRKELDQGGQVLWRRTMYRVQDCELCSLLHQ